MQNLTKKAVFILFLIFILNLGIWWNVFAAFRKLSQPSSIHFLDVGQGDAQLIRNLAGNILIDAGRNKTKVLQELDSILPLGDRIIDIALLTHPQLDHIGGFQEILDRYKVRLLVHTGVNYHSLLYNSLIKKALQKKIPILYAVSGQEIIVGKGKFLVLSPTTLLKDKTVSADTVNDTSIVIEYDENGISTLFTGDISAKKEMDLIGKIGDIDILKVSHHGSKYSSSMEFLAAISPEIAIIGTGNNPYGHPAKEVLERIRAIGAQIFRTDQDGRIDVFLKDDRVQIMKRK